MSENGQDNSAKREDSSKEGPIDATESLLLQRPTRSDEPTQDAISAADITAAAAGLSSTSPDKVRFQVKPHEQSQQPLEAQEQPSTQGEPEHHQQQEGQDRHQVTDAQNEAAEVDTQKHDQLNMFDGLPSQPSTTSTAVALPSTQEVRLTGPTSPTTPPSLTAPLSTLEPASPTPAKKARARYHATEEQLRELMAVFAVHPSPPAEILRALSMRLGMPLASVVFWFKNRRARFGKAGNDPSFTALRSELHTSTVPTPTSTAQKDENDSMEVDDSALGGGSGGSGKRKRKYVRSGIYAKPRGAKGGGGENITGIGAEVAGGHMDGGGGGMESNMGMFNLPFGGGMGDGGGGFGGFGIDDHSGVSGSTVGGASNIGADVADREKKRMREASAPGDSGRGKWGGGELLGDDNPCAAWDSARCERVCMEFFRQKTEWALSMGHSGNKSNGSVVEDAEERVARQVETAKVVAHKFFHEEMQNGITLTSHAQDLSSALQIMDECSSFGLTPVGEGLKMGSKAVLKDFVCRVRSGKAVEVVVAPSMP